MTTHLDALRAPLTLPNGATIPNRIAKAAMTEGLADVHGRPTVELDRLYSAWGQSGCGLLITGNVQIDRDHLERPGNVIIDRQPDAAMAKALARWAAAAKAGGAKLWMQISHAGRQTQAVVNPYPKAASNIPLGLPGKQFGAPVALSAEEIADLVNRYATAAAAAQAAGFDGVQIHSAHGYLLSAFLSPRANNRTDQWGGSLENRARMLLDVVRATRARTGKDFTVAVKLNSADFQKGGFDFADCTQVVKWLAAEGVDLIEISGGNYEQPKMMDIDGIEKPDVGGLAASTAAREAYFADFAAQMRQEVTVPLMVTGGFRTAQGMSQAIRDDGIAMIGIGRPLCVDTACVKRLLDGTLPVLDRWESRLRLGPGLLGPQSPIGLIKVLNGFGATYWYYQQFRRFGKGNSADLKLSVFSALHREMSAQKRWLAERKAS